MRIATLVPAARTLTSLSPGAAPGWRLRVFSGDRCHLRGGGTLSVGLLLLIALGGCQPAATGTAEEASEAADDAPETTASATEGASDGFDSDEARASYMMGFGVTGQVSGQFGDAIEHSAFLAGAQDRLEGKESRVSEADGRKALTSLNDAQMAKMQVAASANAKRGADFLADNGMKEGVVTTASGLQYQVLQEGSGAKPGPTDRVKTHYHGTLINGDVFDSSYERQQPLTFPLNGVIPGWTEALQLMSVGSKYRLFIPPELAYGNQQQGSIPAQSTLIFDVELLEIMGAESS